MSIKYYQLAKDEELPEEFCAVRDVNGEPSEYTWYERMSEYIDIYIDTTTKVPEDATEFDYELFERFVNGGPWVAHSEYMKLKDDSAKLRELCADIYEMAYYEYPSAFETAFAERMRELGVEVD